MRSGSSFRAISLNFRDDGEMVYGPSQFFIVVRNRIFPAPSNAPVIPFTESSLFNPLKATGRCVIEANSSGGLLANVVTK
jgi:hypothetical protein